MEIKVVRNVLEENASLANDVRAMLRSRGQIMVNFMSSPGSGKTKLLEALIPVLQKRQFRVGVVEGDITTTCDAERLKPFNVPIAQICTEFFGGDCHLAPNVVLSGLQAINSTPTDIVLLENVGNLVCPAEFDTGSDFNIVVLSITEGEDKPLKYPLMFRRCEIALVNKMDLAPVLDADVALMKKNIKSVNPSIRIMETSGKSGVGIEELAELIVERHKTLTKNK
jgi:hydrogenase nickel incorporation protein HypB